MICIYTRLCFLKRSDQRLTADEALLRFRSTYSRHVHVIAKLDKELSGCVSVIIRAMRFYKVYIEFFTEHAQVELTFSARLYTVILSDDDSVPRLIRYVHSLFGSFVFQYDEVEFVAVVSDKHGIAHPCEKIGQNVFYIR